MVKPIEHQPAKVAAAPQKSIELAPSKSPARQQPAKPAIPAPAKRRG